MKLAPSGLGAEPKKLMLLGGLVVVLGVVYWTQDRSDSPGQAVSANVGSNVASNLSQPATIPPVKQLPERQAPDKEPDKESASPANEAVEPSIQRRAPLGVDSGNDTFVPSMKPKEDLDVSKIDPRIRLDLLARVRAVPMEGGSSSLFDFSRAPEVAVPKPEAIKPGPVTVPPPAVKAPTTPPPPPGPPAPPPIPFKYYGYAGKAADGQLAGDFIEGDPVTGNIYVKREGDMIKDRYKVVRIGIRSADVEDTVSHTQQTLKLPEDQQ
jgi:hypothetical protein